MSINRLDNFGLFISHSLSGNLCGKNRENINEILHSISPEELIESTFGIEKSEYIKYSKISTRKFKIIINESHICNMQTYLDYLEYPTNGQLIVNIDKIATENYHTHTVYIYPPQDIEGGELIVYHTVPENEDKKSIIKMDKNIWTFIMFPTGVIHNSNTVLKGEKSLLKTQGYILDKYYKKPPKISYFVPQRIGYSYECHLADTSFNNHRRYDEYIKKEEEEEDDCYNAICGLFNESDDDW